MFGTRMVASVGRCMMQRHSQRQWMRTVSGGMGRASASHQHLAAHMSDDGIGRRSYTGSSTTALFAGRKRQIPMNTILNFVPQQEAWVVHRFGKYSRVLEPGLNIVLPVIETISFVHNLRERALEIPSQSAITMDNVTLHLDGVLYLRIVDPYKASYGIEDPEFSVKQLAQTTMRAEIGKLKLDNIFRERDSLNALIVDAINQAAELWGITCLRYEIRDIQLPEPVVEAMQMQVAAERRKRAQILESEGQRESEVNIAEGHKRAKVLSSEADREQSINQALGEAKAIKERAEATAHAVKEVAEAIDSDKSQHALSLRVAEQYIDAFKHLAKETNTLMLPTNTADPAAMIASAMKVYGEVNKHSADKK